MNKYTIDYSSLGEVLEKPKHFKYADVKDKLVKVAYDIVKFEDAQEDIDGLWQIQTTDSGEVIVALYQPEGLKVESNDESLNKTASEKSWEVIAGSDSSVHVFYKGEVISKFAESNFGLEKGQVSSFCKHMAGKLNSDSFYVKALFEEIPVSKKVEIFNKYPELTK